MANDFETDSGKCDKFLSVDEVARLLGVSRSSVFAWSKEGVLPAQRKIGRSSRWSSKELEDWVRNLPRGAYGKEVRKAKNNGGT